MNGWPENIPRESLAFSTYVILEKSLTDTQREFYRDRKQVHLPGSATAWQGYAGAHTQIQCLHQSDEIITILCAAVVRSTFSHLRDDMMGTL
jgi:hypothetical protein